MFADLMRGYIFIAVLFFSSQASAAKIEIGDLTERGTYFIGLGNIQLDFQETSSILPVKSKAQSNSFVLMSGGLYAFSRDILFSVDNLITFYPGNTTETWTATEPKYNGITLTSPVLQKNGFALSLSSTRLLLHSRLNEHWFVLGGTSFDTHSFKRYSFVSGPDNAVNTSNLSTVVESSSEVLLNLGLGLESEQIRSKPKHYGLRFLVGVPIWRRVENTAQPQYEFSNARGYNLAVEGRYSWAIHNNVQVGPWARLTKSQRGKQTVGGVIELPASKLNSVGIGVELLWKF